MKQVSSRMAPAGYILVILLLWELAVRLFHIPLYILPAPTAIAAALGEEWPVLVSHGAVTVLEALAGILISLILALALGILMDRFPAVQRGIYPLLVVTQTVPMIVLAPILIIYMGFGPGPKILTVVLMCFFPVAVSFSDGLSRVDEEYVHLVCKDTTFSDRMQAFTLTFYARKAISSCNTISSIDFLSELYCKNNENARKDSEVAEEMKRGHLVSMSFRVI